MPSVEGERAGNGNGNGNGYGDNGNVGNMDSMTSGSDADSMRVEAALLAAKSQYMHYSRRIRRGNSPVSSSPPVQFANRLYGLVRHRWRRRRLKIERINISQMKEVEMTHLGCAHTTQPPGNSSNNAYGIVRPRHRCSDIKIAPRNVSQTRAVEKTHLGCVNAIRSLWRPKKQIRRVNKLTFECRMPGECQRDDEDHR